ncbi:MAG: hypothetical protein LBQ12_09915 [Deltaproteobacteria bacterium]|jgi:hypothetical protein|nr:hypothetical protein [Deltaproteobacteria bacterium]
MKATFPSKPASRQRATKRALALALPAIAIALAAVSCGKKTDEEAWRSFEILMNASFGENGWSTASHAFDAESDTLTVQGLDADFKNATQSLPPEYAGLLNGKARAATVTVTGILAPGSMRMVATAKTWAGQPETLLARALSVKGISAPLATGEFSLELSADALDMENVKLAANSDPPPAEGTEDLTLISSVEFGSLSKKGIKVSLGFPVSMISPAPAEANPLETFAQAADEASGGGQASSSGAPSDQAAPAAASGPRVKLEATLASFEGKDMGFAPLPPPFPGAPPLLGLILGQKAASLAWEDFSLTSEGLPYTGDATLTLSSLAITGLESLGKTASIAISGLKAEAAGSGPGSFGPASFEAGQLNSTGLDITPAYPVYLPAIVQALATGDSSFFRKAKTMAEYIVYPYSLDSLSADGFAMDYTGFKLEGGNFSVTGPLKAWTLSDCSVEFSGRLSFQGAPGTSANDAASKFQELFGFASFGTKASTSIRISPGGGFEFALGTLNAEGIADFSGNIKLTGVTQSTVDTLKLISADDPDQMQLLSALSSIGIGGVAANFNDTALTKALISESAKDKGTSEEEFRAALVVGIGDTLADQMGAPPQAFGQLLKAFGDFLANPTSLSVAANPSSPVSIATVSPYIAANDIPGFYSFLNVTVKYGDNPPVPFFDAAALTAAPPQEPSEPVDEMDME